MKRRDIVLLAVVVVAAMLVSLLAGKVLLPFGAWNLADPRWVIIAELRLPRTISAAIVGAGLGISGAAMQG